MPADPPRLAGLDAAERRGCDPRLAEQLRFLVAVDALKTVERRTRIQAGLRRENSAEHSWHAALALLLLSEHGPAEADPGRAMRLLLVHDLVEIDAGDTFCYDELANRDKEAREQAAAERLFGILPADQAALLRELWDEFEARETPEARMAHAVDRLLPLMHNLMDGGGTWRENGITADPRPGPDASPGRDLPRAARHGAGVAGGGRRGRQAGARRGRWIRASVALSGGFAARRPGRLAQEVEGCVALPPAPRSASLPPPSRHARPAASFAPRRAS